MYTLIRVRPKGGDRYPWKGHIYDISESSMRFELDEALEPGTEVDVRAMLPGACHITFTASGRVIRLHDDLDDMGPMRMGLVIDSFKSSSDETRLTTYLATNGLKAA